MEIEPETTPTAVIERCAAQKVDTQTEIVITEEEVQK